MGYKLDKNIILGYATLIMIFIGALLIGLGALTYYDLTGIGFAFAGLGFWAIAWVFNALKGRV